MLEGSWTCCSSFLLCSRTMHELHYSNAVKLVISCMNTHHYLLRGSWRGGPNPISQEIVFLKSQLKSHNPSLCYSNWNPIPIFLLFFCESQSQCTKSHFPASKIGKSQLPFYPFTTLPQVNNKCLILFSCHQILLCLTPADFTRQRETP